MLSGCDCVPEIGWGPDVLRPVFYGHRDYTTAEGAPGTLRVFYPSLDGAPDGAPIVECVGEFPLVVFMHGQCSETDHHLKWFRLGATLARCGYIVAMPLLANSLQPWIDPHPDLTLGVDVLGWMRSDWEMSSRVMAEPNTAFAGHSRGALLAARLAVDQPSAAYVSLGGVWTDWLPTATPPSPLPSLPCPSLLAWGTADAQADVSTIWGSLPQPRHKLLFDNGDHWDYLPAASTTCESSVGPCSLVEGLAADFTAVFISKYMPPEASAPFTIPDDLTVPAIALTADQTFYAGAHLTSFPLIATTAGCSATLEWSTASGTGLRNLP